MTYSWNIYYRSGVRMIETERLLLREYTIDDFDALYEIMSDAETMQHYPAPFDETRTRQWIEWNLETFSMEFKNSHYAFEQ